MAAFRCQMVTIQEVTMLRKLTSLALAYVFMTVLAVPAHVWAADEKINIGYQGVLCEIPTYIALEKGFFKEEGLDVTLIKGDWNTVKEGTSAGKIHAAQGLLMNWLKPIEQGIDVKLTIGLHTGCLKVIASEKSGIKDIASLKGKKIGVPAFGSAPHLIAYRAVARAGLNPETDVQWKVYPTPELKIALEKNEVEAVAIADPVGAIIEKDVPSLTLLDSAKSKPYADEFCCALGINGKLVKSNPALAAKISRAYAKASLWISENRAEAADIITAKKYVPIDKEFAAQVLQHYDYRPSVDDAKKALADASKELKEVGLLASSTNPERLAKFAFVELKGLDSYKETPKRYGSY